MTREEAIGKAYSIADMPRDDTTLKELIDEIFDGHEEITKYWLSGCKKIDQLVEELKGKEAIIQHYETKLFRDEVIK